MRLVSTSDTLCYITNLTDLFNDLTKVLAVSLLIAQGKIPVHGGVEGSTLLTKMILDNRALWRTSDCDERFAFALLLRSCIMAVPSTSSSTPERNRHLSTVTLLRIAPHSIVHTLLLGMSKDEAPFTNDIIAPSFRTSFGRAGLTKWR